MDTLIYCQLYKASIKRQNNTCQACKVAIQQATTINTICIIAIGGTHTINLLVVRWRVATDGALRPNFKFGTWCCSNSKHHCNSNVQSQCFPFQCVCVCVLLERNAKMFVCIHFEQSNRYIYLWWQCNDATTQGDTMMMPRLFIETIHVT